MSRTNGCGRAKRKSHARATKMRTDRRKEAERAGVSLVESSPPKIWMNTGQEMGQMQKGGSKKKKKNSSELVVWENLVVMVMDVEVEEGIWWMAAVIVALARR